MSTYSKERSFVRNANSQNLPYALLMSAKVMASSMILITKYIAKATLNKIIPFVNLD